MTQTNPPPPPPPFSDPTPDQPSAALPPEAVSKDARTMGMLAHLLGAFTSVLGPLVIWLTKKDESPFVDDQSKEALNFQITILFAYIALIPVSCITMGIGSILYLPLWVLDLVFSIMGCMKANDGVTYRYPFAIRLIK